MEDQNTITNSAEHLVDNIGAGRFQVGLASAINQTYTYASNSLFFGLYPAFYKDYAWRYIYPAVQWLDGYVPALHQGGASGIISTRIGSKLITGLTKTVVGEKLVYRLVSNVDNRETLKFVNRWSEESKAFKSVYAGIGYALGTGTSLIKINKTADQRLWWEAVRSDRCFFLSSFNDELLEATFLIRGYTDTRPDHAKTQFYLVEHRYYKTGKAEIVELEDGTFAPVHGKNDRIPMVEYKVYRVSGTIFTNTMPKIDETNGVKWEELPHDIRKMIRNDYAAIRVGEPQELGFTNLGVELLKNGVTDLSVPTASSFGESLLVGIQSDMTTYEIAASYKIRDMYLGKGTVYLPKSLSIGDLVQQPKGLNANIGNNNLSGIGETPYELVKGVDPSKQQILINQFNIREKEWQDAMDNSLKNIAMKWGMSPKVLASYLATSMTAATATQIDSEDDMSVAFIYHTRAYFKEALNRLLETTLNFYGIPNNISIGFTSPSLINKDRVLRRVTESLKQNLITMEDAIREMNPDAEEDEIQRKLTELVIKKDSVENTQQPLEVKEDVKTLESEGKLIS